MISAELSDAVRDLRYLLDRGFPRDSAVTFVANHYRLKLDERHLLARCVFSGAEILSHRAKAVGNTKVRGKRLGIDGYNVLITVESLLTGKQVVKCDDGFIRDLRAIFGKYHTSSVTPRALTEILKTISRWKPMEVVMMFDRQMSRSGELAAKVRRMLKQGGIIGDARAVVGVDFKVRGFDVVASGDRAIIERVKAVWDLPAEILKRKKAKIIDLTRV
jgi:hypothetical protein